MTLNQTIASATGAPNNHPVVRVEQISKSFGDVHVLADIDLDLRAGEIHALMGENGAGKSTLIKILSGDLRPDGGSIHVSGAKVEIRSANDASELRIAVVHQELSVIPNLTVAENLFLGRELTQGGRLDRRRMDEEARRLVARLGMDLDPQTVVSKLDVAERQAIEICRALSQDAVLLILDEPTAALTETERHRLFVVLEHLRAEGLAILYVSHHLSEIERLADRVTVLRNGAVVLERERGQFSGPEIVHAMLGEPVEELFPSAAAEGPGDAMVRLKSVSYGRRLKDVSYEVARGEIVGITGLLGSGYREAGRLAAGVLGRTSGAIERPGRVVRFSPGERKEEGLALERTAAENLTLHALPLASYNAGFRFLSRRREERLARGWSSRLSLTGDVMASVRALSGGNQQKILVGRNLDGRADLLVLEEPTRGVDVGARQDLYELIRGEADRGCAVLVVSTDLREVVGLCDRVIVVNGGRITQTFGRGCSEDEVYEACHAEQAGTDDHEARRVAASSSLLRRVLGDRASVPWLAMMVLAVVTALTSSAFVTGENLQNLARQSVGTGLIGLAQLGVVLTGHIDLSVGQVVAASNLMTTDLLMHGVSPWLTLLIVLGFGASVGAVNALAVRLGAPSLLSTFAMASILQGAIIWRYSDSVGPVPESFRKIDTDDVFGIPIAFLALLVIFAIAEWVLRHTKFGLRLYAVGGDVRSSTLAGIRPGRIVTYAFVLSGTLSALSGFHLTARLGAGLPNGGTGLELDAVAVVMIGGASILGGSGTVRGLLAGVGIVIILANLMNLNGVDAFYQDPIKGGVIILVSAIWGARLLVTRRRAAQGT